jgi:diguanylate cyclase (GGDEF)-like protein
MSTSSAVIAMILLQQGCFAVLWAAFASQGLARSSTICWAAATALVTLGMLMMGLRGQVVDLVSFQGANVAVLLGFVALYRGVGSFARRPPATAQELVLLAIGAAILAPNLAAGMQSWQFACCSALMGFIILRTAWFIHHDLAPEFGGSVARLCAVPFWLMGAVLAARALSAALSEGKAAYAYQTDGGSLALLLAYLVFGMLINFGLMGMVLSRALTRLRHLSERDALTGLYNRRSIEQRLAQESAQLVRHGTAFSLLSIDIDHFKRINDQHGHPAGDRVLKDLAKAMVQVGRGTDLLARAGGEEFWMLMPQTTLAGAIQVAERALQAARELRFEGPLESIHTRVSIGLVVADDPSESMESVMARLDLALYSAKDSGRDRIELARPRTSRLGDVSSGAHIVPAPPKQEDARERPRATV